MWANLLVGGTTMKRTIVLIATIGLVSFGAVAPAQAAGPGNGSAGCELSGGADFRNPAEMLKALTVRDGSFQTTVDLYPGSFASVGDLIGQKCGA